MPEQHLLISLEIAFANQINQSAQLPCRCKPGRVKLLPVQQRAELPLSQFG